MAGSTDRDPRWNLFARELEDALAARGLRLGHLDNRRDEWGAPLVHREKVRRLQRSLRVPKSFTLLNPDELRRVAEAFELTQEEQMRLYAALLATSVEVTLMDRIDPQSALRAAEQILPVLRQAMEEPARTEALRAVRGGGSKMVTHDPDSTDLDVRFEKALDALDRATLALHLSRSSERYQDQIDHAQQAHDKFCTALRLLGTADPHEREDEAWQLWHAEAQEGRTAAAEILARFGIRPGAPE
jgi:hypothetical protein